LRLFNSALGGQVSWLLPLALLGLVAAAWRTRVQFRPRFALDRRQQSLVLWGAWLLTTATFFSVAGFFHSYYMVTMAPSIAALAGIGVVSLWRDYRAAGWRGWALPLVLLITAGAQVDLLAPYPSWSAWLTPLVLGLSVIAALALVLARLSDRPRARAGLAAVSLGVAAMLAAPTVWAADTVAHGSGGATPTAGPRPQVGAGGFRGAGFTGQGARTGAFDGRGGFGTGGRFDGRGGFGTGGRFDGRGGFGAGGRFGGPESATANTQLVRYLEQHQGTATYLLATASSMTAAPIIIQTGKPVMALGGFSGADQILTTSQLTALVAQGTVHYFLIASGGFRGFGGGGNSALAQWVIAHGTVVPASQYGASSTGGFGQTQLYYVSSAAAGR
jgi:4-amino-4-deoxy-L-arabinose transferase-like glycosyltransferase